MNPKEAKRLSEIKIIELGAIVNKNLPELKDVSEYMFRNPRTIAIR